MLLIGALGASAFLFSLLRFPVEQLTLRFLIMVVITLGIGSRITVRIPRFTSRISVSDTFIFLTMLMAGGEAAILLATVDAGVTSHRITKKNLIRLFNTGVMACSTFLTVWALRICCGSILDMTQQGYTPVFFLAICIMALSQYIFNSGIVAVGCALRANAPIWQTWRQNYLWTSITYFAGASAAGLITKLISVFGFQAFIATTPIIAIVYFTYQTYLKNIEASMEQADQAERHVSELQESEERFRSAFDHAAIGMALVSMEGRWLQVNRSLCEIVGYSEEDMLTMNFQSITHPDDLGTVLSHVNDLMDGKIPTYQTEKRYVHKQGHEVWILLSISGIRRAKSGDSMRLIFQIQDITARKRAEQQLQHDAFHDALTGLPNRALFIDHMKLAIARAKRRDDYQFAVLFLDLDRFKVINDSLGHMVGDQLLVGIARRLETCLRPGDTVARLGGDEFTVLLEDITDTGEAISVAERVEKELALPFNLSGHEVFSTVSVGIAPSSIGYDRPDDILRDADTAMYRAKSLGKSRHEVFDKAMHARAMNLLQLETDLRRALDRDEFLVYYQPIVSLETGMISGFEALVRWQHPEHGFISPSEFIPVAEENGLIVPIGQWVLHEACRQMKVWHVQYPSYPPLKISVNLSGKQFAQPDLIEQIRRVLRETGLPPQCLKLEITESVVMDSIESAIEMLKQLHELGVESSIDDFGTGYSSLSYLHRFPASTLKIDRSFVSRMTDHGENIEIVKTVIMLAQNLDMNVVAEGVETEDQLATLRAMGCEFGQGYLFSKPTSKDIVSLLLSEAHSYALPASASSNFIDEQNILAA
jgi:diguanylate cyclase (GGDEF)-like protein/PAS domain S-box-containing protein